MTFARSQMSLREDMQARVFENRILSQREQCRLMVYQNRIPRRVFEPNMDANGARRRLHNEELHGLYHSPNISRGIKSRRLIWVGNVARREEGRSASKNLTCKPTGKKSLGRTRCRWDANIRMDVKEIGINTRNWADLAQDRDYWRALVNAALNLWVP